MSNKLTAEEIFAIQKQQLLAWKARLKPECFSDISKEVMSENIKWHKLPKKSQNPYYIFRGCQIDELVMNWYPK